MKDNLAFVIVLVGLLLLSARFLFGCGSFLRAVDDPELADLNARLAMCRAEGRAWKDDAGLRSASAYMKYEDCKRREHIEGADAP